MLVMAMSARRRDIGRKVIKSITVFRPAFQQNAYRPMGYHEMANWPALLLEIVPYSENLRAQADELQALYLDTSRRVITNFPNITCEAIGFNQPPSTLPF
jgi:hypothetical protein